MITTTIIEYDDSLGICIAESILDELNLSEGSEVEISIQNKNILITPKFTIEEIVSKISKSNCHQEIDLDKKDS
jgi:antitoxin MazE